MTGAVEMNYFQISFFLFLLAGFFITPSPVWAMTFYAGVAPLTVWEIWSKKENPDWLKEPLLVLSFAVIVWFGLTLLWGVNQTWPRIGQYGLAIVTNSLFVVAGLRFFRNDGNPWRERLFRWLPIAIIANILIAGVHFYVLQGNPFGMRLTGWAETRHQILGSDIIVVIAIVALRNLLSPTAPRYRPATHLPQAAGLLAAIIFIVLSGSRGSFIALAFSAGLMLWLIRPRLAFLAALGFVAVAGGLLVLSEPLRHLVTETVARDPMRLRIWSITLDYAAQRPLLGYGVATVATFGEDWITFPHSMYFSALFYGGVIGLALMLFLFIAVAWRVLRTTQADGRAFLLALLSIPLVAGLADTGQFIKNPSPQWYIVWLPLVIAMALSGQRQPAGDDLPQKTDGVRSDQ